jgi:hypothetical protein
MILNGEMTKIKVVDLQSYETLLFTTFSFEIIYYFKILFKIQFWNCDELWFLFLIYG